MRQKLKTNNCLFFFAIILIVSFQNWQIIKIIRKIKKIGSSDLFFVIFVIIC